MAAPDTPAETFKRALGHAARALAEGRPAIVEARDADAFRAASAALGVAGRAAGTVRGHNYSQGDDVSLTIYAPPPTAARTTP